MTCQLQRRRFEAAETAIKTVSGASRNKEKLKRRNNMALKVRRIVTGHNASGLSAVKTDELLPGVSRGIAGITGWELWSTDQMPVDNSAAADAAQRAGFVKHLIPNYVGTGGARRSGSTRSLPALRDSRTAPKPWTTVSSCQVSLTANSKAVRSCI